MIYLGDDILPSHIRAYKQAAAIIFWITFQPISMIQRPNGFWTLLKKWSCRFCRFAMFSMDSACVGHLTARPLMAATAEGDDETAVMRLTVDDGSWRCGDYTKTASQMTMRTCEPSVPLKKMFFRCFFCLISDGSIPWCCGIKRAVGSANAVQVCNSKFCQVQTGSFVVFLFPGIWQIS